MKTCSDCKYFGFEEFYTEDNYCFAPTCYFGKEWKIEDFSEDTQACEDYAEAE